MGGGRRRTFSPTPPNTAKETISTNVNAIHSFLSALCSSLAGICPLSTFKLERNRPRKQNVVLQVDVLVQISLKFRQGLVEGLIANAGVGWNGIAITGRSKGP